TSWTGRPFCGNNSHRRVNPGKADAACRSITPAALPTIRDRRPGVPTSVDRPQRGARTPLVHDLRRWPIDRRLPGRVLDARDFGRVFEHVSAGGLEIRERIVAGRVPAGTPAQLHVLLQETPDAAHHLIQTAHL